MLELRRGRSQSHDYPLMGTLHEMEIDVLGITGITVDRSKLQKSGGRNAQGIAPPEKMKAVVAVFSEGHFCASSGLSQPLRKTQSEPKSAAEAKSSRSSEGLIALWGKRSRTSKIKFAIQMDHSISSSDPAIFEMWIALTDGKGENKTCVSFPIGLGTLPVDGEQSKPFLLDLPIDGLSPNQKQGGDGAASPLGSRDEVSSSMSGGEEKKNEERSEEPPAVGTVYGLKNHGGAILRLKVECKRKKHKKDRRRAARLSDLNEDQASDDEGSKMFRPIETSSLVSESAYSLGDVVSSRLPTKTLDKHKADLNFLLEDIGGIDESQEMDFSDIGSRSTRPSVDRSGRSGKPFENGPKSAFTAISPSKTAPLTCSTATIGKSDVSGQPGYPLVRLAPDSTLNGSPLDLGTLDPKQEEPSELGDSLRIHGKQIPVAVEEVSYDDALDLPDLLPGAQSLLGDPDKKPAPGAPQQFEQVPLVIRTVSQIRGKRSASRQKRPLGGNRSGGSTDQSLVKSIVSTAVKKEEMPSCIPYCGVFGPMLRIPLTTLVKDAEGELVLRDFEDDHTWSTIETRNSSQIVAWHDSVRAYAAETTSVSGDNRGLIFDRQCARDTHEFLTKRMTTAKSSSQGTDGGGWWNDLPGGTNGCM